MADELEKQRSKILSKLAKIVGLAEQVNQEMVSVPHVRGLAYRSLKLKSGPKGGMFITHTEKGFDAEYHEGDKKYEVKIYKI